MADIGEPEPTEVSAVHNPRDSLVEITHEDLIEEKTQEGEKSDQGIKKETGVIGDESITEVREGKGQDETKIEIIEENTTKGKKMVLVD